ncbi:MAG: hypothetical protein RI991_1185, partial [Bacteroidota bacterium]
MSVLIYTEHQDGKFKKNSLEAISYGVTLANHSGAEAFALVVGNTTASLSDLGNYGVKKVLHVQT